jgi:hypothetical protein
MTRGSDYVFKIVEYDQRGVLCVDVPAERGQQVLPGTFMYADGPGDGRYDERRL